MAPATCGAAMLVPVLVVYRQQQASGQQLQQLPARLAASALAEVISRPGAAMLGFSIRPAATFGCRASGPRLDEGVMPVDGQQSHTLVRAA